MRSHVAGAKPETNVSQTARHGYRQFRAGKRVIIRFSGLAAPTGPEKRRRNLAKNSPFGEIRHRH
ncbi:hypothetical protein Y88_2831 [Novosphingobium nitrogenifigens DSM 19370]|uniref:Uncharacterized protein n=1 Tax=Novosphingobium nitrogenifigens DSM 19370 TaxID=983920 RepID=F1Z4D1_9SPHN|nr:hypothetical protein Y88_2831 [Novosphingobium nitrogenifigens DSM 19370]